MKARRVIVAVVGIAGVTALLAALAPTDATPTPAAAEPTDGLHHVRCRMTSTPEGEIQTVLQDLGPVSDPVSGTETITLGQ